MFFNTNKSRENGNYYLIPSLFTNEERKFFYIITTLLKQHGLIIFPKVRLADIIEAKSNDLSTYWKDHEKIIAKQLDFLVCKDVTFKPEFIIQLDDPNYKRKDSITNDIYIENTLKLCGLKLHTIKVSNNYNQEQLRSQLKLDKEYKKTNSF